MVLRGVGSGSTNKAESMNHVNTTWNPKNDYLSSTRYIRGLMFAYLDTVTQWLHVNGDDVEPWPAEVFAHAADALGLPRSTLQLSPLAKLVLERRSASRVNESQHRSTVHAKMDRAIKRRDLKLRLAGEYRDRPGQFYEADKFKNLPCVTICPCCLKTACA